MRPLRSISDSQLSGDQVTRDDEEDVDPEEAGGEESHPGVVQQYETDGDGTEAGNVAPEAIGRRSCRRSPVTRRRRWSVRHCHLAGKPDSPVGGQVSASQTRCRVRRNHGVLPTGWGPKDASFCVAQPQLTTTVQTHLARFWLLPVIGYGGAGHCTPGRAAAIRCRRRHRPGSRGRGLVPDRQCVGRG